MEVFNETEDEWQGLPDQPPLPSPTPPPPLELAREATPCKRKANQEQGETLQELENERLAAASSIIREQLYGPLYAHLPNVYLDWELEGYICRVIGSRCFGHDFVHLHLLKRHLESGYHQAHNATHGPVERTPPPRQNYVRQENRILGTEVDRIDIQEAATDDVTLFPELINHQDTPSRATAIQHLQLEIEDSEDSCSELPTNQHLLSEVRDSGDLEIPPSESLLSEIPDSEGSPQLPLTDLPNATKPGLDYETDHESESVESVIVVVPCEVANCEKCIEFTVSHI
ncbi:hypothetical protein N5P37_007645 [Trichoderma harzianum]|nr:hypothetical protein N5P37_007645 [Trichoderma harzianum]